MTRQDAIALRAKLETILTALGEDGYDFEIGRATYGEEDCTFKVAIRKAGAPNRLQQDFVAYARLYGLTAEDYGRTFTYHGDEYKLVGIKPRASKYPFVVRKNGDLYKLTRKAVLTSLGLTVN